MFGMGAFGCCRRSSEDVPTASDPKTAEATACEEIAGEYLLLKETFVRQESVLESAQVAELKRGSLVTITEIVDLVEKHRILGRVEEPAGWITLRDKVSGVVRASRTMRIPDASKLKAGHALIAMSKLAMRIDEAIDSACVAELPEDEPLEVLQVGAGRRIQVKSAKGHVGWVSIKTEDGVPILKQHVAQSATEEAAVAGRGGGDPSAVVVRDDAMGAAALKIQAVHRGNEARKEVAAKAETKQDAASQEAPTERSDVPAAEPKERSPSPADESTERQAVITEVSALRIVSLSDPSDAQTCREEVPQLDRVRPNPREVEAKHQPCCNVVMCCH